MGFAATVIGLLAVLLGLVAKGGLRIGLAFLLAIISFSGVIGTYQHFANSAEGGEAVRPALGQANAATYVEIAYRPGAELMPIQEDDESSEGGERVGGEGGEETPPPLAPLSLAGLSLMGAAILLAKQD